MITARTCPKCFDIYQGDEWQTLCGACAQYEYDKRDNEPPEAPYEDEFWPIDNRRDV